LQHGWRDGVGIVDARLINARSFVAAKKESFIFAVIKMRNDDGPPPAMPN
jgi:hypothetical protein